MKLFHIFCAAFGLAVSACSPKPQASAEHTFITVNDSGQFIRDGKPYYYVGANFWYGAILGSTGKGGDRQRLHKELDFLKDIGVSNLRVLVGADGPDGVKTRVEPALQVAPGVYNDTILDGLDYFMNELKKRDMTAVLYLNNSWEWSGGYSLYLQWSGHGDAVVPAIDGWPAFMDYVKQYALSDSAQALFAKHVDYIVGRTNRYNGLKYTEDPTLMSWQIGNEPRAFSEEGKAPFARWMSRVAAQIRALDANHLISSGSEGSWGCENDMALFEQIHADPNISYLNIHIWPYNSKDVPVTARDDYYNYVFGLIRQDRENGGLFAGCNFWAWGGFANPAHEYWERGDDYTGDPAQEQQGLNSVFASDSTTIAIIRAENEKLK